MTNEIRNQAFLYAKNYVEGNNFKYEIHEFDSDCKMIDLWINDEFYCLEFHDNYLGISNINGDDKDLGSLRYPDEEYQSFQSFREAFEREIMSPNNLLKKGETKNKVLRLIENKLTYVVIVYFSTMFIPWREIYKGQSLFTTLPMWWEYGNPLKNYTSIFIHITFSIIVGFIIHAIIKRVRNKMVNK